MQKKTLRIKYPQWHGGVNPNYVLGSNLLSIIAPPNPKDEEFDLDDKKDDNSQNRMIDIDSEEEKFGNGKSLYEIIYKLKHNTDLNELINRINLELKTKFDKKYH